MILFKLRCSAGHEFEGWFRDNAAFDRQQGRGLIACPDCGVSAVEKAPMAPRLGRSSKGKDERPAPPAKPQAVPDAPPSPADMRRALQELRKQVETHCDYVGPNFAAEARKRHKGEENPRGIYGEASQAEARKLADDGIEIASIPWIPTSDA